MSTFGFAFFLIKFPCGFKTFMVILNFDIVNPETNSTYLIYITFQGVTWGPKGVPGIATPACSLLIPEHLL